MKSEYIFKIFRTPRRYYLYDRHTNSVLELPKEDYMEFNKIQNGEIKPWIVRYL